MKDIVLKYLQENGSITTLQAMKDLGCCDLQHYIMILRKDYEIKDEWKTSVNRFGKKVSYKKYYLCKN